jgi:enoyl-CoA hydratase
MPTNTDSVLIQRDGKVLHVIVNRPQVRNAVDSVTAHTLGEVFAQFNDDDELCVAVLSGADKTFCAGFDLREVAEDRRTTVDQTGSGPMGCTWMQLSKPVIAAIEGHAVAGGLELAL